jgi:hypothetical protein
MSLPADVLPKLRRLIPLLASDKGGEVIATTAAISRILEVSGYNWHDLATALTEQPRLVVVWPRPAPGRATHGDLLHMACEVDGHPDLSPWEIDFVSGVRRTLRLGYPLSSKQRRILGLTWERLCEEAAA